MTDSPAAPRPQGPNGAGLPRFDVVTLGESMVTFLPSRPGRLADVPSFERAIGGAESNVACGLAAAGHRVAWVSRVGTDGFGEYLLDTIASYGVDTSAVRRDAHRSTGVYFRTAGERAFHPAGGGHADAPAPPEASVSEVVYYRAGSAASAMSCANTPADVLRSGRVLHLTGITAALSPDCRDLLHDLTGRGGRTGSRPLLSFDVNHRSALWRAGDDPGAVLGDLAGRCDLVFVGDDEAHALWGVAGGPAAVRAVLPEPRVLVVKQGATGVTVFNRPQAPEAHTAREEHVAPTGDPAPQAQAQATAAPRAPAPDTVTFVPALSVDVVAPVGAGDAFAAGFLSATLRGLPVRDRIRHGHLMAAAVLTVPGDLATPPGRADADRLAALDDEAWAALSLTPGWTGAPAASAVRGGPGQEVCAP